MTVFSGSNTIGVVLQLGTDNPSTLVAGGYITNTTATHNGDGVYGTNAAAWTFSNYGTINATRAGSRGIAFQNGGTITNAATGSINGKYRGIEVLGARGAVANLGTIGASDPSVSLANSMAVLLRKGGVVVNGAPTATSALIGGGSFSQGVYFGNFHVNYGTSAAGTVVNYGTISSQHYTAVVMSQGGTVTNSGLIAGNLDFGVYIRYGLVTNNAGGLITGGLAGVQSFNPPIGGLTTVVNLGTVAGVGAASNGVRLRVGGTVRNAAGGLITGPLNGVTFDTPSAGLVSNFGTIAGTGPNGTGVALQGGGSVTNGSTANAAALISAGAQGVLIAGGPGIVTNFATILATGTAGAAVNLIGTSGGTLANYGAIKSTTTGTLAVGVALRFGGIITNGSAGSIVATRTAIYTGGNGGTAYSGAIATVTNLGTVLSTGAYSSVLLRAGGLVTNLGRIFSAARNGILIGTTSFASIGTVSNSGTIGSGATFSDAVYLGAGGSVTNAAGGLIQGVWVGVGAKNVVATVTNFGTIASTATFTQPGSLGGNPGATLVGVGAVLEQGGLVVNGTMGSTAGLISGYALGVYIGGGAGIPHAGAIGTIVNYGTIASTGTGGVGAPAAELSSGGFIANYGTIVSAASNGVHIKGTVAATVKNAGVIASLSTGTRGEAVYMGTGGLLRNYGQIIGAHPGMPVVGTTGGYPGVVDALNQPLTVVNYGTIVNPNNSNGVNLLRGGLLINGPNGALSALISAQHGGVYMGGRFGVAYPGAVGTVVNYGTIQNSGSLAPGVELASGGIVINRGLIASGRTGVSFHNTAGTLNNLGTIVSTAPTTYAHGVGAYLQSGGYITNAAGGLISALRTAVLLGVNTAGFGTTTQSATVTNAGVIVGSAGIVIGAYDTASNVIFNTGTIIGTAGTAIAFGGSENQLTLGVGSVISGNIDGGGGSYDVLEFAFGEGIGTFSAGVQLTNFTGSNGSNLIEVDKGATWVVSGSGTLPAVFRIVDSGTLTFAGDVHTYGLLAVREGGVVSGADIVSGGIETVLANGLDIGATIDSGGTQVVAQGGTAVNTLLDAAATQTVFGTASGTTISNGDSQIVAAGGVAVAATVSSGGTQAVLTGATASGSIISGGGQEIIASGATAGGATIAGGLLDLQAGAAAGGTIAFTGTGGTFEIDGATMPTTPISGFVFGDTIDLRALAFAPGMMSATVQNNILSVTSAGTVVDQLTLSGITDGTQFTVASDGAPGGTAIGRVKPKLAYMTGTTDPWNNQFGPSNPGSPDSAMNTAFGVGNWIKLQGFNAAALTAGYQFIYLDGGDGDAGQFDTFISSNRAALQAFVAGGGRLFINAARWSTVIPANEVNFNVGFGGVTFQAHDYSPRGTALQPTNPIFLGPNGAAGTSWTGSYFSHDFITGNGLNNLIQASGGVNGTGITLAGEKYGAGYVMFGGITSPFFQSPQPQADILRANILDYVEGAAIIQVPPPTSVALSPASESGVAGSNDTNVTTPVITGLGVAGDTVTVFDGSTAVGTGTVQASGTWSVTTSLLTDGAHSITAMEADAAGNVSAPSAALSLTIDTSAPQPTATTLTVSPVAAATPIGIVAPTDANDPASALMVTVTALPNNGTVTLADGTSAVTAGEPLTVAQLTGLEFKPNGTGGTHSSFVYTVTDTAGNAGIGTATLATNGSSLFQFFFVYADGKDYFYGTVADDGTFGYAVGQTVQAPAGQYSIFGNSGVTGQKAGTVFATYYSHNGPGEASPLPVDFAAHLPDSTTGLLNVSDAVLGTDGVQHPFGSSSEATFTANSLFGFSFSYTDGREFYTGTVATAPGSAPTVQTSPIGRYAVFAEGITARAVGTVVVDRFTAGSAAFIPNGSGAGGAVDGTAGLGSEADTVTVNGATSAFSDTMEPTLSLATPAVPTTPIPSTGSVFTSEVYGLYRDVFNRDPDPGGLSNYTTALANGQTIASIRAILANSPESQTKLNTLYNQVFGRDLDASGRATFTNFLANGSGLAAVQLLIGESAEAQSQIQVLYQAVLNRAADGSGLTNAMGFLANGGSLSALRNILAHSSEAAGQLAALFATANSGRAPDAAELAGMEGQLNAGGATQATIVPGLGFTKAAPAAGSQMLTAAPGAPTEFDFSNVSFGNDTINGFDPTIDAILLPKSLSTGFTDAGTASGDTLISFANDPGQSVLLSGLSADRFGAANFRFV